MMSPKDGTQRRMLNQNINPKLAKIANRSPLDKYSQKDHQPLASRKKIGDRNNDYQQQQILSPRQQTRGQSPVPIAPSKQLQPSKSLGLENGDRFEGQILNSLYHGKGSYLFLKENLAYEGEFQEGKQHGMGILGNAQSKAVIYEGQWLHGYKHGEGRYIYGEGHYYQGEWEQDMKQGKGLYHNQEGVYNGGWVRNKREGLGSLKLNNGLEFKGSFDNDQFSRGIVRYPNGDQYSGPVRNNLREGDDGSYYEAKSNNRFKGQWHNDQKNGKGTIYFFDSGDELSGTFYDDLLSEDAVVMYRWKDGSVFNGWFRGGVPNKGSIARPNGQKWQI